MARTAVEPQGPFYWQDQEELADLEAALLQEFEDETERPQHGDSSAVPREQAGSSPPTQAPQPGSPPRPPARAAGIGDLTEPCLLRVLCFLPPEDLSNLSQVNRALRGAASDPAIWKALYQSRWPDGGPTEQGAEGEPSWQANYMARDAAEVRDQLGRAPDAFRELYQQMAVAKRSEAMSLAQSEGLFAAPANAGSLSSRVAAFRQGLGLASGSGRGGAAAGAPQEGGPRGGCAGVCSYVALEAHTFICELGGEVHACGEACTEWSIDPATTMPVCRLTGRCFERLMSEFDPGGGEEREEREDGRGDWNAQEEGMGGRLGRAFYAGYNAVDEHEMLVRFGVKM